MTVWLFGQENPRLGATGGFPAEAVVASRRAAELLLAQPDVAELSKQIELGLFYDAKLDVAAMT